MTDRVTMIETPHGSYGVYGRLTRDEAIAAAKASYERQATEALDTLADIARGDVKVFTQSGVLVAHNRTEITE